MTAEDGPTRICSRWPKSTPTTTPGRLANYANGRRRPANVSKTPIWFGFAFAAIGREPTAGRSTRRNPRKPGQNKFPEFLKIIVKNILTGGRCWLYLGHDANETRRTKRNNTRTNNHVKHHQRHNQRFIRLRGLRNRAANRSRHSKTQISKQRFQLLFGNAARSRRRFGRRVASRRRSRYGFFRRRPTLRHLRKQQPGRRGLQFQLNRPSWRASINSKIIFEFPIDDPPGRR